MRKYLALTGARKGQTCVLNGKNFVDGRLDVTDVQPEHMATLKAYFENCHDVVCEEETDEQRVARTERVQEPERPAPATPPVQFRPDAGASARQPAVSGNRDHGRGNAAGNRHPNAGMGQGVKP